MFKSSQTAAATTGNTVPDEITPRLIEGLYIDAMLLGDEARSYFENSDSEQGAETGGHALRGDARINMSCESLRLTTRLMHATAWLLNQKAYFAGELGYNQLRSQGIMLGDVPVSDPDIVAEFEEEARILIHGSEFLYARVKRIERQMRLSETRNSVRQNKATVHALQEQLQSALG